MREIRRGQMYYARKGKDYMHKRGTGRPVIVVSNDAMNKCSNRVMVIYLTKQDKGRQENVEVICNDTLSYAICNNINTVFKDTLETYIGEVTQDVMSLIDEQIAIGVGIENVLEVSESEASKDECLPLCIGCHLTQRNSYLEKQIHDAEKEAEFYKRAYYELLERVVPRA